MAKARLIATLLASIAAFPAAAAAADGAHWNGGSYVRATTITNIDQTSVAAWAAMQENPPRPYARAGMCSYWFSAPTTAMRRAAVYAVYPDLFASQPNARPSVLIEHYPAFGGTRVHLLVQLSGAVISKMDSYSLGIIPYFTGTETPNSKHHIEVLWDSWQGAVQFKLDGNPMGLDGSLSSSIGVPFDFAADKMSWTVGAQLIPGSTAGSFVPTNFLFGDTNENYCVLGDSVYTVMTTPELNGTTYTNPIYFDYDPTTKAQIGPYPTPMGPHCSEVFGFSREWPYICMRKAPPFFQGNDGLAAFTLFGTLTPATYSPFDLIPTINP